MAVSDASTAQKRRLLTVLSYNIHGARGLTRRRDTGRVARVIRAAKPDIVALQEVENSPGNLPDSRQLSSLADQTGLTAIPGPTLFREDGDYGNAILSRLPILDVRRHDLSYAGREARGALDVELAFENTRVRVIATHLGLTSGERRFQKNRLKKVVSTSDVQPLILMGDMNEWLPLGPAFHFFHDGRGRTPLRRTFPALLPLFPLDRIFVFPGTALKKIETVRTFEARIASDHLPLLAVLEF